MKPSFTELLREHLGAEWYLSDEQFRALEEHYTLLTRWNQRMNLTSVEDMEELVVQHYCECVALGSFLPSGSLKIADAGSGAGFPGIPLAIARPECRVTLIESDGRKAVFLREASLDLANVNVRRMRLEDFSDPCEWLVSRAIRWDELVSACRRLGANLAVLVTSATVAEVIRDSRLSWSVPISMKWGKQKVVLIGTSSRGPGDEPALG